MRLAYLYLLSFNLRVRGIKTLCHSFTRRVVLGVRLPKMSRATAHHCQCCSGCTLVDTMIPVVAVTTPHALEVRSLICRLSNLIYIV